MKRASFLLSRLALCAGLGASVGCTGDDDIAGGNDGAPTALFDFGAELTSNLHFYDAPFPSDLRLDAEGHPDLRGLPLPRAAETIFRPVVETAQQRKGWSTLPVGYFRFDAPVQEHLEPTPFAASFESPVVLIDVDESSPERGRLIPTVLVTPPQDPYSPSYLMAIAPRPGMVLEPKRTYAFAVFREYGQQSGTALGVPAQLAAMARGESDAAPAAATTLYAKLFDTLRAKNVDPGRVAAATVFTTGDVIADTFELSERVKAKYSVSIEDLAVDADDGAAHADYCELTGTVRYPQFQKGTPPFNTEGLFELDADGVPVQFREEAAPVTIAIPKGDVPAAGIPLVLYFHGSGGQGREVVDAAKITDPATEPDGPRGQGPASIMTPAGFAMAATSLPFSIDRFPDSSEQEYLNFNNLAAFRDTFRQGIVEQRMFAEALRTLRIPRATLASCEGVNLPEGQDDFGFDENTLFAMGQSMGGAYTHYLSGLEPRIKAAVPTGAGGHWTYFVLDTPLIENVRGKIAVLLGANQPISFLHPALSTLSTAWESIDPIVYLPRLGRNPLPGHPARSVYKPAGRGDRYFPIGVYDAMALSYRHPQAGELIWPSMQEALALEGLDGLLPYPVANNLVSANGQPYTSTVVQYEGDGVADPHAIYRQLDAVKYQYRCFFESFHRTGTGSVLAPAPLSSPCPR